MRRGQRRTYLSLCFPPYLPELHSNHQRMPHWSGRSVHWLVGRFGINDSHSDDSPQESLVWVIWLLSLEAFQLFVIKKGLYLKIILHPKSLELLRQWEVCEDHIMDLNSGGLVFLKWKPICPRIPLVQRVPPPGSLGCWPGNHVQFICGLEGLTVDHQHCWRKIEAVVGWLFSCWVEKWLDEKTNMMLHLIPRWVKLHCD